jgi:hypothetical protein
MTLRITIEIVPFVVEKDKQTISVIDISNQGRATDSDNFKYDAALCMNGLHGVAQQRTTLQNGSAFYIAERTVHCPASSVRLKRSNARISSLPRVCRIRRRSPDGLAGLNRALRSK